MSADDLIACPVENCPTCQPTPSFPSAGLSEVKVFKGCTDHDCVYIALYPRAPGAMGTNGGCRCDAHPVIRALAQRLREAEQERDKANMGIEHWKGLVESMSIPQSDEVAAVKATAWDDKVAATKQIVALTPRIAQLEEPVEDGAVRDPFDGSHG